MMDMHSIDYNIGMIIKQTNRVIYNLQIYIDIPKSVQKNGLKPATLQTDLPATAYRTNKHISVN